MTNKQTYLHISRSILLCLAVILLNSFSAEAQLSKRIYRTKVLEDTLVANNNRDFLYNNINITNLTNDSISILVTITMPKGWMMTTQKILTVSLPANQNTIINLRLLPQKSISADWESVKIEYRLNKGVETLTDSFRVKVEEFTKFKARLPIPEMVLGAYQKDITFPVYVKNTGNVPKEYVISFYNNLLNLSYKQEIFLEPTADTTYKIPLRLTDAQWSVLRREEIKVQVGLKDGETMNLIQEISKIGYMLKEHSSAYQDMPLQAEVGTTMQGTDDIQAYGALHGRLEIKEGERLSFDVRSKTFAQGQFLDNDIYLVNYEGRKWEASAGNIQQLSDFVMDGFGVSVTRKWDGENNNVGLYSMVKSRVGNSRLFGANAMLTTLKDRVRLYESAIVNLDSTNLLNSYMLKQSAVTKINEDMSVKLTTGVGLEQSRRNLANTNNTQVGTSLGYNFQWNHDYFSILSAVAFNSNSYPGVFKGQRSQNHDVRAIYERVFLGGFYDYNLRKQNVYTDTQLFSDVFNLKSSNYGAKTGYSFKNSNVTLAAGIQRQQQSDSTAAPIYEYRYLNLNTSIMLGNKSYANINSYYGAGMLDGQEENTTVNVMSNQGSLQVHFAGLSARYDIGPYFYHDYLKYLQQPDTYRRVVLSPYAQKHFFKQSLMVRAQYNYTTTRPTDNETSSLLGNIIYHNFRHGFDFNATGIIPFNQPNAQPYITLSLRVQLHVPFVAVRKYYTLKLILYKDENLNGKLDEGEGAIPEQMLALNDNLFVSDAEGRVIFKNVEKKDFKADFGYTSKIRGWIPQGGTIQTFAVTGNKTIYIPYKKSKVLSGKLKIDLDRNSNLDFDLGNIKVTATANDSVRASYSTLTNSAGEFYFNLPAGMYTVSLSQVAFDDKFRPTEFAQQADLVNNDEKTIYFEIKQKRRSINIRRK